MLVGSAGTLESLRRGSKRKKPRRFAGTRGEIGLVMVVGETGDIADMGRLRLNRSPPNCGFFCGEMSRTAPAVLGRPFSNVMLIAGRVMRGGVDVPMLMIEDRLPVAECPRIVDMEVSVSDEIVESGRMYSTLSEKPTRALDTGRCGEESEDSGKNPLSRSDGCDTDLFTE